MAITFFLPRIDARGHREPDLAPSQGGERLEHDPEKACPGLDPGWVPVFGKDHAPPISESGMTIRRKVITL
jgi:hypothetical protein